MYKNIFYERERNLIHLWDDQMGYTQFPYKKYAYKKAIHGEYETIHGEKVTKVYRWSKGEPDLFETDVHPETRVLVDLYSDSDEISEGHTILTMDIEVEMESGLPDPLKSDNMITSIALHDSTTDQYWVLILDEKGQLKRRTSSNVEVIPFDDEASLLMKYIELYEEINPSIVTGWNIDYFDTPYLYNRLVNVLGKPWANRLSPIGKCYYSGNRERFIIAGVSYLDYINIYKKFNYSELPNYQLNTVALIELKKGKIEYDGNLDQLFHTDIEKFIEYNLVDVELVVGLDRKLKYIELCQGICHAGHTPYETYPHSSRYLEGAILTYLKKRDLVANNKPEKIEMFVEKMNGNVVKVNSIPAKVHSTGFIKIKKTQTVTIHVEYISIDRDTNTFVLSEPLSKKEICDRGSSVLLDFTGAWVKDPQVGRHEWLYDLDLTSLYPSIIMSLNISPETKVAKIANWDVNKWTSGLIDEIIIEGGKSLTKDEFKKFLDKNDVSVSSNGVIYDTSKVGCIPGILNLWFDQRVEYKDLMKKHGKAGEQELYEFYDKRQLVQKILLNSLYGVLGLSTFRFYDIDNAGATTSTGQDVIKNSQKCINLKYNKYLGTTGIDYVIYVDTDSCYVSSIPILDMNHPDWRQKSKEDIGRLVDEVATQTQDYVNYFYNTMAKKLFNVDTHRFEIKKEYISEAGFWVTKKRYAQKIILNNGVKVNKTDIKGLDVKRSSFPKYFQDLMRDVLNSILDGKTETEVSDMISDFKEKMDTMDVSGFAKNSSLKTYEKYNKKGRERFSSAKGVPINVKSAMVYNDCLEHFNCSFKYAPFKSGDKIKYVYLKNNPYGFSTMAFNGHNDPAEVLEIANTFIDRKKMFEKELTRKLQDFYDALNWGDVESNKRNAEKFFTFS